MNALKRLRLFFATSLMAAPLLSTASAQTFQSQITGVVRDPSGAVIPNARVVATNSATGVSFSAESNEQGIFRLLALPPAQYKVATSARGFKTSEQGPVTLQVNDVVELDVALQVGDASEQVQVSGTAPGRRAGAATGGAGGGARRG